MKTSTIALIFSIILSLFVGFVDAFDAGDAIALIVGLIILFVVILAILGYCARKRAGS